MTAIVHLCSTCRAGPLPLADLAAALLDAGIDAELRAHPCLNVCAAPVALSLQGRGRATCLFSGVDPEADRDDIIATIRAWQAAPAGWIDDARPCGRLRHRLVGRVPAP